MAVPSESALHRNRPIVRRISTAVLLVTLFWCACWLIHGWGYWEDDAYIHLEFARSVAAQHGFAFNGRVVAGDTAPVWVLLLATVHAFFINWMVAGKLTAILGAAVGFSGIYALAARLAQVIPNRFEACLFPAAVVLLVALNPYTCFWIFSGMESFAAAGLTCWAVLLTFPLRPRESTLLAACMILGISPLVRPELGLLAVVLAFPLFASWRRLSPRTRMRSIFVGSVLLLAPLLSWSFYSLHAFHHLLPNTNAAKRAAPGASVLYRLLLIYATGFPLVLAAVPAAGALLVLKWAPVHRSGRAFWSSLVKGVAPETLAPAWSILLWALITTIFYVINHTYVQTRYILLSGPALVAAILVVVYLVSRPAARFIYIGAIIVELVVSLVIAWPFVRNKAYNCEAIAKLSSFMRDKIPAGTPVATYSIGEIAFLSQQTIIDTGGITRPEVIPYLTRSDDAVIRWAQSEGAQYFMGSKPQPDAVLIYHSSVRFAVWTAHPLLFNSGEPLELWQLHPAR